MHIHYITFTECYIKSPGGNLETDSYSSWDPCFGSLLWPCGTEFRRVQKPKNKSKASNKEYMAKSCGSNESSAVQAPRPLPTPPFLGVLQNEGHPL